MIMFGLRDVEQEDEITEKGSTLPLRPLVRPFVAVRGVVVEDLLQSPLTRPVENSGELNMLSHLVGWLPPNMARSFIPFVIASSAVGSIERESISPPVRRAMCASISLLARST